MAVDEVDDRQVVGVRLVRGDEERDEGAAGTGEPVGLQLPDVDEVRERLAGGERAEEVLLDALGEEDPLQGSLQPVTSRRCSSDSGEKRQPSGSSRRRNAIRSSASSPGGTPCRTSQQPTTVPVRPIPPQQWT